MHARLQYGIWILLWIGWNTFLICFYLNVGILNRVSTWRAQNNIAIESCCLFFFLLCRLSSVASCTKLMQFCEFSLHNTMSHIFYSIQIFFRFPLPFPMSTRHTFTTQQDSDILSLGTGAVSWFEVNGYGCVPTYPTNITSEDPFRLVRPEYVDGCLLEWYTVEIIQSAVQLCLAVKRNYFLWKRKIQWINSCYLLFCFGRRGT